MITAAKMDEMRNVEMVKYIYDLRGGPIRKWSYDLNDAIELLEEMGFALMCPEIPDGKWRVKYVGPGWQFAPVAGEDHSPARAICKAWIAWKQGGGDTSYD